MDSLTRRVARLAAFFSTCASGLTASCGDAPSPDLETLSSRLLTEEVFCYNDYAVEIATRLRLLATKFGSNKPLLLQLMVSPRGPGLTNLSSCQSILPKRREQPDLKHPGGISTQ